MKKHISVFNLLSLMTAGKLLPGLIILAALQTVLFLCFGRNGDYFMTGTIGAIEGILLAGAYALTVICCANAGSTRKQSVSSYTVLRLSVSERTFMLWHLLVSILSFFLFFFSEMLLFLLFGRMYENSPAFREGLQGIYTDYYRNKLIYPLYPFAEPLLIARNAVFLVSSSCVSVYASCASRHHKRANLMPFFIVITISFFRRDLSDSAVMPVFDMLISGGTGIFALVLAFIYVHNGKAAPDEGDEEEEALI